jgi:hypothetical protein
MIRFEIGEQMTFVTGFSKKVIQMIRFKEISEGLSILKPGSILRTHFRIFPIFETLEGWQPKMNPVSNSLVSGFGFLRLTRVLGRGFITMN